MARLTGVSACALAAWGDPLCLCERGYLTSYPRVKLLELQKKTSDKKEADLSDTVAKLREQLRSESEQLQTAKSLAEVLRLELEKKEEENEVMQAELAKSKAELSALRQQRQVGD